LVSENVATAGEIYCGFTFLKRHIFYSTVDVRSCKAVTVIAVTVQSDSDGPVVVCRTILFADQ
jgi:hypothetical protein